MSTTVTDPSAASSNVEANLIDTLAQETLALLEWPELQAHLVGLCHTPVGRQHWETPTFSQHAPRIRARLAETDDLLRLYQREGALPSSVTQRPFLPVAEGLNRLGKGAPLAIDDWTALLGTLHQGRQWVVWMRRQLADQQKASQPAHLPANHPIPWHWLWELPTPDEALALLSGTFSMEGQVLDEASPALNDLRTKYRRQQKQFQQLLDSLLSRMAGLLNESYYTQRNGRFVFPVAATHKASFGGVLHDSSASGQTLYIEPAAIIEPHNKLLATEREMALEIDAILASLASTLAPQAGELSHFVASLGRLDALWAGAVLGHRLKATVPKLHDPLLPTQLNLLAAKHPLLLLKATDDRKVVANDIKLGPQQRMLVVTGPNTGGKTVALKTVGLCALMVRAGLAIPVKEGSSISVLAPVLADLGDAQSLTQNLSTFSGHIRRLAGFVAPQAVLSQALVLVDEIGAGTDPVEGAALATVMLKALFDKGALSLVTTHLSALKWEAHQHEGYLNASMVFDLETLSPTYRLMLGVPGTSHALSIAQRLGVPLELIDQAKHLMAQSERDSTALLVDLEARRLTTEMDQGQVTTLKKELEDRTQALKDEVQSLRENKKRMLLEYRAGLKQRFQDVEQQLKAMRKHLRKVESEAPNASHIRLTGARLRHVEGLTDGVVNEAMAPLDQEAAAPVPKANAFTPGQEVLVVSMNQRAVVEQVSADGKKVQVKVGPMRLAVSLKDLELVQGSMTAQAAAALKRHEQKQIVSRLRQVPHAGIVKLSASSGGLGGGGPAGLECDIRGQRVEDALLELERYLDSALRAGYEVVGVIHGQGTGALKKAVREYLAGQPFIKRFYPDEAHRGGDGKTVIELKG
jgi:DNA mismatch repair protein MutS2